MWQETPTLKHYSAMNERDDSTLYEGASTGDILAIDFPATAIYSDVTVTVTSPEINDSPALSFSAINLYQFCSGCHESCGVEDDGDMFQQDFVHERVSKTDVTASSE